VGDRSTRDGMRSDEWFLPRLGTQQAHEAWEAAGKPDVVDEARQKVDDLLATHAPAPWDDGVEEALAQLYARALRA
ncbi:MAG: trimethylamine methyltransferase family protein, partial [Thermoleophilia bacterium]|jgi:trimethylamine:corrinoid methyltransferase-like protein|nr:trimethylamine methyltransferase family protein [Thermoleophilia bacterium]